MPGVLQHATLVRSDDRPRHGVPGAGSRLEARESRDEIAAVSLILAFRPGTALHNAHASHDLSHTEFIRLSWNHDRASGVNPDWNGLRHMHVSGRPSRLIAESDSSGMDLVQRCLEGDRAAWDVLVRTYWKQVFNLAYKFVARYDEAEDLTQEIFVKLFRSLATYDRRANFHTWLTTVTRNLCVDHYRRRRREAERFTSEVDPDTLTIGELVTRPDATFEQRDDVAMVRRAMAMLPASYKTPVVLRDVHEMSYEEIARRLQLPEGTVKSRINRGRKELARHLRVLQGYQYEGSHSQKHSRHRQETSHAHD